MASIASLGLSGLPLNDLLADLRQVEETPLKLLSARKQTLESRISSYGTLSNALSTFQTVAKELAEAKTYGALKTTVSNSDVLTATSTPGGGAVAGTYNIKVIALADTQTLASQGQASRTDVLSNNDATLTFTLGDGTTKELQVGAGQTSLEGLRDAINAADLGLSATIINNGDDSNPFVLSISTTSTGIDASITKITLDNSDLTSLLSYNKDDLNTAMHEMRQAIDARLEVNGIVITSGSNTLKDAIEGIELSLKAPTDAGKSSVVTIVEDRDTTRKAIENFVKTYNTLQATISNLTRYDVESQTSSALTGDHVARSVQTQVRSIMGSLVDSDGEVSTLSQLGITTNVLNGTLEINKDKLDEVLSTRMADVQAFFSGKNGLVAKLNNRIDTMLGPDGSIAAGQDGAKSSIKNLETQYEGLSARIEQKMVAYRTQFVALEKMMSQMNGISSYLSSQLGMLESMAKNSSSGK